MGLLWRILKESREIKRHMPNLLFGDPFKCTYCGDSVDCIDHVIPISSYSMSRKQLEKSGVRTFSCNHCNQALGSRVFDSFRDRLLFVNRRIVKKAQEYRNEASWSDDEICELDHTLRTFVANRQVGMRLADERSIWLHSAGFFSSVSGLRCHDLLDPSSPKFIEWLHNYFADYCSL